MKFRNGFVTNSSSSNFIVAFKSIPSTVEDVQKQLFGLQRKIFKKKDKWDPVVTCKEASEFIFNLIKDEHPNNIKAIKSASGMLCSDDANEPDYDPNTPRRDPYNNNWWTKPYKKAEKNFDISLRKYMKAKKKRFVKKNKNKFIYVVRIASDEGLMGRICECNLIFKKLDYFRLSNH